MGFLEKYIKNKEKLIYIIVYPIIFLTFMGTNFLKFNINGINFNLAKIYMLIPIVFLIADIIREKGLKLKINAKSIKYCVIYLIIWGIYSVLTIYRNEDVKSYLIENFFLCIGTLDILFFIKHVNIEKSKNSIFYLIVIALVINCLYYIYLYYIKNINIGGFYHNTNDLATALTLAIFILINLIINSKGKKIIAEIICLVIFIFTFFSISSRACILGLAFGISIYIILNIIKYRKQIFINKKNIYITIILSIILCITAVFVLNKYLGNISFNPIEDAESSNDVRVNLIFNGLKFLSEDLNWITGIGAGNSEFFLKNYSIYSIHETYSFHNPILQISVTYGILFAIGFIISYIIYLIWLYKMDNNLKTVASVFYLFLLSLCISNISSSGLFTKEWIWITFAIIITFINEKSKSR